MNDVASQPEQDFAAAPGSRAELARLHRDRAPFYGEAPIRVTSESSPHLATAANIIEAIGTWL